MRLRPRELHPGVLRAGELRHGRRHADVRAPRRPATRCGWRRSAGRSAPTTRCGWSTRTATTSPTARSASCSAARPVHAARLLRRAGVQRARLHPRRLLPLRRPDAAPPLRQLHRRGPQEGPDQPRRREDQRRGDREPRSSATRPCRTSPACRCPTGARRADVRLRRCRGPEALDVGRARRVPAQARRSPSSSCPSAWRCSTTSRSHRSARSPSGTSSPGSPEPQIRRSGRRPSSTYFAIGAVPPSRCHCSSAAK